MGASQKIITVYFLYKRAEKTLSLSTVSCLLCAFFYRFPVKRLSATKQEPQEKKVQKPVKETPPQGPSGRWRMKQQKEKEEEDKKEVLSQSLKNRDKNIKENKAMVRKSYCFLHIHLYCLITSALLSHCMTLVLILLLSFSWLSCLLI